MKSLYLVLSSDYWIQVFSTCINKYTTQTKGNRFCITSSYFSNNWDANKEKNSICGNLILNWNKGSQGKFCGTNQLMNVLHWSKINAKTLTFLGQKRNTNLVQKLFLTFCFLIHLWLFFFSVKRFWIHSSCPFFNCSFVTHYQATN